MLVRQTFDPIWFKFLQATTSRKQPRHINLTFWVVTYGRFDLVNLNFNHLDFTPYWWKCNIPKTIKEFEAYLSISIAAKSTTARPMGSSFPTRSKSRTLTMSGTVMSSIGTQNFSFHWGFKFFCTVLLLYICFPSVLNFTYGSLVPEIKTMLRLSVAIPLNVQYCSIYPRGEVKICLSNSDLWLPTKMHTITGNFMYQKATALSSLIQ